MPGPAPQNEDSLTAAAAASADGFAAFYRHFERSILGFFMAATGRPDLAADLAAETFASALESIDSFDPERGRADQWLFGIARNVLRSSYRRGRVAAAARGRLELPRLALDDHALETIAALNDDPERARMALAALPTPQRDAIEARVVHERAYDQIAAEMKCSEAVVRQRVSRGLRALRTRLEGDR